MLNPLFQEVRKVVDPPDDLLRHWVRQRRGSDQRAAPAVRLRRGEAQALDVDEVARRIVALQRGLAPLVVQGLHALAAPARWRSEALEGARCDDVVRARPRDRCRGESASGRAGSDRRGSGWPCYRYAHPSRRRASAANHWPPSARGPCLWPGAAGSLSSSQPRPVRAARQPTELRPARAALMWRPRAMKPLRIDDFPVFTSVSLERTLHELSPCSCHRGCCHPTVSASQAAGSLVVQRFWGGERCGELCGPGPGDHSDDLVARRRRRSAGWHAPACSGWREGIPA